MGEVSLVRMRWLGLVLVAAMCGCRREQPVVERFGPADPVAREQWGLERRSALATMTPEWLVRQCGYPATNALEEEYASRVGVVPRRRMGYRGSDGGVRTVSFLYIEGVWAGPAISKGEVAYPMGSDGDLVRVLVDLPCLGK
jgi:hypothetical protein